MGVLTEEITKTLLALPISDRAILADRLVDSLDDREDEASVREAWISEIRQRNADIKSGNAKLIDGDEGYARVRALF